MALRYFDGFETYGVIPAGTTANGVRSTVPLTAAGWSGTGITATDAQNIGRPASAADADRRSWITTKSSGGIASHTRNTPYRPMMKSAPIDPAATAATFGFKVCGPNPQVVLAYGEWTGVARLNVGKFVVDLTFSSTGVAGRVQISSPSPGNTAAGLLTATCTASGITPVLGQSSWQWGNVINTVECTMTKPASGNSTFTLWVNNVFVGSAEVAPTTTTDLGMNLVITEFGMGISDTGYQNELYVTDLYMLDNAGAAPTSRLGKVKVVTRVPTADVEVTFQRPVGAATNASVAAQIPPSTTTVLSGINDGDTDLYSAPAFGFSNESIIATAIVTSGFKTDAGGNNIQAALRVGGVVYTGDQIVLPNSSNYATNMSIFTTNPATGLKFTKAELDAAAFGVRVKDPLA